MAEQYWGIDLGGTKIEGVVLGGTDAPDPLCRIRIRTEADRGYRHVIGRIAELLQAMEAEVARLTAETQARVAANDFSAVAQIAADIAKVQEQLKAVEAGSDETVQALVSAVRRDRALQ